MQKGKDSLQLRGEMANLGNKAYHFTPHFVTSKIQKQLKNKKILIAYTLLSEGRESAVPAGWFTAAPAGVFELRDASVSRACCLHGKMCRINN